MEDINTAKELNDVLASDGGRLLVCFWKNACPGCMKVSKLLPLIEGDDCRIIRFDCSNGYDEASEYGINATPVWHLYEDGSKTGSIHPASDDEDLWEFLTETAGLDILRPFFDIALDQGRAYAKRVQSAIAELMFRSEDDCDGIVTAAVLKICRACESVSVEDIDSCIDEHAARCIRRLRDMDSDGDTEIRSEAIEKILGKKEEIRTQLAEAKNAAV